MNKIDKVNERLREHIGEAVVHLFNCGFTSDHYSIEGIYLQGSQNYGVDHEHSDIDSKLVVVPKLPLLIVGKGNDLSRELTISQNEKVTVKTIPQYCDMFMKGNVNNLEMLFTDYAITGEFIGAIKQRRELIVRQTMRTVLDAAVGMAMQKRKSLHTGTITTQPFVDQHGYDNKDAVHILRLCCMVDGLIRGESFETALFVKHEVRNFMMMLRNGWKDVEFVTCWADKVIADTAQQVKDSGILNDPQLSETRKWMDEKYVEIYMKGGFN